MKRDIKYDYIRIVSMLAIVMCHLLQVIGVTQVGLWLNVGVQVFLVLSAKLVSGKKFESVSEVALFFKSRVLRIFIPVWIYLACLLPVLAVLGRWPGVTVAGMYIVGLAGFSKQTVLGLGHFWYITVLLICYLLVPVMYKIANYCKTQKGFKSLCVKMIVPTLSVLAFLFTKYKYYGVNIALFSGAYFWFNKKNSDENWYKGKFRFFIPVLLILIPAKVFLDGTDIVNNLYYDGLFYTAVKCVLGLFLFFLFYNIFPQKDKGKLLNCLSDISYEVYIAHQFIILALYEFIPVFKNGIVGGLLMLICSIVLSLINAIILYYMKIFVEKRILRK